MLLTPDSLKATILNLLANIRRAASAAKAITSFLKTKQNAMEFVFVVYISFFP